MRFAVALGALLALVCRAEVGWAGQDRPDPLRLVPAEVDFVVQIRDPVRVAELARESELLAKFGKLGLVKDQFDTTSARRGLQLLAYFEKHLGDRWYKLLPRIAGGGVVLAGHFGDRTPAVLVIQGTDEKSMKEFVALGARLVEAELARQESKEKLVSKSDKGIDAYQLGDGLFAARLGSALVVSNNKTALAGSAALHLGKSKKSLATHKRFVESNDLLPEKPLADAWINLELLKRSPEVKALYGSPRDNAQLTVLAGGLLDVLGRSPFVRAALTHDKGGYGVTIRAPRGRDGMGPDMALHVPPKGGPGLAPLLEPKGVLYSNSFYFDATKVWTDRDKLFTKANADALAQADKTVGKFLLGNKISLLLDSVGSNHRVVVANQSKPGYKKQSKVTVPAFAFVTEMRKPERFSRTADLILRAAALSQTDQFDLLLKEEKHAGVEVVAYRFGESKELLDDANDLRFAFSPCYARVGKQFIFCSTVELCRDLIDLLLAEQKAGDKARLARPTDRFYSAGFADLLLGVEDQLITQAILGQATEPAEAKAQIRQLIALVRTLGDVTSHTEYRDKEWRYSVWLGK